MSSLRGSKELRARLKAIGQVFKPYGRIWADDTAANMRAVVPVRTGALRKSIRRKNATAKRATVAAAYWSNFIDAGSKEHDIFAKKAPFLVFNAGGSTIFARRVHKQRIAAKPFKRKAALQALRDNPMSDELKKLLERGRVVGFQTDVREAALTTVLAYASSASVTLQGYRARPAKIAPPTAFVDELSEDQGHVVSPNLQRTVQAQLVVLWGLFDSGEAVDQRDAFIDGYIDYMQGQRSVIANAVFGIVSTADEPTFTPDWLPAPLQKTYFGTRITLEGYTGQ